MRKDRIFFISTLVIASIASVFGVLVGIAHPAVMYLFGQGSGEHVYGIHYYYSDRYLQYDDGQEFQTFLLDYSATEKGRAVEFWHEDFTGYDNLFYGKHYDIYAADFVFTDNEYETLKHRVAEEHTEPLFVERGYCAYAVSNTVDSGKYMCFRVVAFCDEAQIVRYIMLNDWRTSEIDDKAVDVILNHRYLDWEVPESQGDGSLGS